MTVTAKATILLLVVREHRIPRSARPSIQPADPTCMMTDSLQYTYSTHEVSVDEYTKRT